VSIRTYVPIVLDLDDDSSYGQWSRLFDTVFTKFGLHHHVADDAVPRRRDPDWATADACIVNWLYTSISRGFYDVVMDMEPNHTALQVWTAIRVNFHNNAFKCAVSLEAEFWALQQGGCKVDLI